MENNTASIVAHAINLNCEHYHAGNISRTEWSAEQERLWKLAADRHCAAETMRMVCPSLGGQS